MRLTPDQIYAVAINAGFPADTAVKMVAIAMRESSGETTAHNATPPDDSYGLWQINMLGSLGVARMSQFGLTSKEQLFDPDTNAAAAFRLWNYNDNNLNVAWYINRPGPYQDRYNSFLPAAQQARANYDAAAAGGTVLAGNAGAGSGEVDVSFRIAPAASSRPLVLVPLATSGTGSQARGALLLPLSAAPSPSISSSDVAAVLESLCAAGGRDAIARGVLQWLNAQKHA